MVESPDDVIAIIALGEAAWGQLVGVRETEWLEFKGQPYAIQEVYGRLALAEDVASLANTVGGLIVIGVATQRDATTNADTGDEIRPIPVARLNLQQLEDLIAEYVTPVPEQLSLHLWQDSSGERAIATIHVPRQDSARKYFLVTHGVAENGNVLANHVGLFERIGASCRAMSTDRVYELIRQGRRILDESDTSSRAPPYSEEAPDTARKARVVPADSGDDKDANSLVAWTEEARQRAFPSEGD